MKIVARFEKVPFEQFKKDWEKTDFNKDEDYIRKIYDKIQLPRRSTKRSSGYDFRFPMDLLFLHGKSVMIPSGIRCVFTEDGYDLVCMPRSGYGVKYRLQLDNTIGLIDNDYFEAKNTGHIMFKMTCCDNNGAELMIKSNEAYVQGVFREYFLAEEDEVETNREGGWGSTSK